MAYRSSQKAINFIVASEVTSPAAYARLYARPTWPKGRSGVTIGIGYDLGFQTPESVKRDWGAVLPADMIAALGSVTGITGTAAQAATARIKNRVLVPYAAAQKVFEQHELPRWESTVLKALPGSENLPPDCFGALTSLTLNRGASYLTAGERYKEMRAIRAAIQTDQWQKVPGLIRAMKRIWAGEEHSSGLLVRRDGEADMFELGLRAVPAGVTDISAAARDPGPKRLDMSPRFNIGVQNEQKGLLELGYPELGDADGKFGGKTRGTIAMLLNDRGQPPHDGDRTVDFQKELSTALREHRAGTWSRPIAEKRATATVAEISEKVPGVNQNAFQKAIAWVAGVPALIWGGLKGMFGDSADPNSYIDSVKNVFSGVPTEYYLVLVVGICVAIYLSARYSDKSLVKAYQENKIN